MAGNETDLYGALEADRNATPDELKKQYEVVRISATSPIEEELDGLAAYNMASMVSLCCKMHEEGTPERDAADR